MTSSSSERRLIVNGDDFGSPRRSTWYHTRPAHGILTNTSLMVTGSAWRSVALPKTRRLSAWTPSDARAGRVVQAPHLLTRVTQPNGTSLTSTIAGIRYFSRQAREQLRDECRAQIEWFRN